MLIGIDHVQLAAPPGCEEDARRFFGALLGLDEIEKPDALRGRGGVWFRIGAAKGGRRRQRGRRDSWETQVLRRGSVG